MMAAGGRPQGLGGTEATAGGGGHSGRGYFDGGGGGSGRRPVKVLAVAAMVDEGGGHVVSQTSPCAQSLAPCNACPPDAPLNPQPPTHTRQG